MCARVCSYGCASVFLPVYLCLPACLPVCLSCLNVRVHAISVFLMVALLYFRLPPAETPVS